MTIVGVGVSEHYRSPKGGNMVNQLYYTQVIPQPIVIQDSINCKIKGFYASINIGHHLLRTNHFILFFGIGANGGRLQLFDKGNINKTTRIITPKAFLTPLVYFGRLTFSFSVEYDYDLFHYPWKNRGSVKQNNFFPVHIKQTCITGLVKLGFSIGK